MLNDKQELKEALIAALSHVEVGTPTQDTNTIEGKELVSAESKVGIDLIVPDTRLAPSRPSGLNDVYVA